MVLRKACVRETTSACHNDEGGRELPPDTWEERDGARLQMSAYCRTYYDVRRVENKNAYPNANETNGMSENPPATRTRSPPSPNGNYNDPSPCAALRVRDF